MVVHLRSDLELGAFRVGESPVTAELEAVAQWKHHVETQTIYNFALVLFEHGCVILQLFKWVGFQRLTSLHHQLHHLVRVHYTPAFLEDFLESFCFFDCMRTYTAAMSMAFVLLFAFMLHVIVVNWHQQGASIHFLKQT
jgi:hypothetical protein